MARLCDAVIEGVQIGSREETDHITPIGKLHAVTTVGTQRRIVTYILGKIKL